MQESHCGGGGSGPEPPPVEPSQKEQSISRSSIKETIPFGIFITSFLEINIIK